MNAAAEIAATTGKPAPTMNRATSVYLDALRLFAAVGVFVGHAQLAWFSTGVRLFPDIAHELVVLFFFLSGYVVADATLGKRRGTEAYAVARLSRLASVVLPAIVLTIVARALGSLMNPEFYAQFERGQEPMRWALTGLFVQELWFLSASPPTNAPLWSLGYEFWFYALFGCAVFTLGAWRRLGLLALVALVAGPKLLLLLPVWLLGVAGWHLRAREVLSLWLARAGVVGSAVAAWMLVRSGWLCPGGESAVPPWFYSGRWVSDTVLGAIIFVHVFCFDQAFRSASLPGWLERPVRAGASVTFSLYAYHYPLLVLAAAIVPGDKTSTARVIALLLAILAVIVGLRRVTEARRGWWQAGIANALNWLRRRPAVAGS